MSMHTEWDHAAECEIFLVSQDDSEEELGETIGTEFALVLGGGGGGCLAIEGSPEQLIAFAQRVLKAVTSIAEPTR